MIFVKVKFFDAIIKTPSSGQNCHEVNENWTLPIPLMAIQASLRYLCLANSAGETWSNFPPVPAKSLPDLVSLIQSISEYPGRNATLFRGLPARNEKVLYLSGHVIFSFVSCFKCMDLVIVMCVILYNYTIFKIRQKMCQKWQIEF